MIQPTAPDVDGLPAKGRDRAGRFAPGNRASKGNPHAVQVAKLRATLLGAVTPADLKAVIGKMIEAAKAGEPWAIKETLDRCIGRAVPAEPDAGDGVVKIIVTHVGREIDHDADD